MHCLMYSCTADKMLLALQTTMTMAMAATTTMSTGVVTMVTAMATSTTAAPLQLLLPLLQVAALQLLQRLPLADQQSTGP